jgi:hypothetical protein
MYARFLLFLLLVVLSCSGSDRDIAQKEPGSEKISVFPEPKLPFAPKSYICCRVSGDIDIDGKILERSWQDAPWTDYFVDIEGSLKPEPRFKTRAKMLWDDKYFYVAAELEEPDVWAKLVKRDTIIFYDNDFEVFIDPDGDTHQYFELEVNAFATEWDLFLTRPYRDRGKAIFFWDIGGLKTGVSIDGTINKPGDKDEGWTVEIAFPWDVLKECAPGGRPPEPGEQWRVNFSRVEWKTEVKDGEYQKLINSETGKPFPEDNWVWSPQGIINMHYPEMWGFVQFSDKKAGEGTDSFVFKKEEVAKFLLRQIYYKEHTNYRKTGNYTDDMKIMGMANVKVEGYSWPPEIKYTWDNFEARIRDLNTNDIWTIDKYGLVLKTER